MNETRGNSRTKQVKNPIFPKDFTEREPLKEKENHSLKDSEKTTGYNSKVKNSLKNENLYFPILDQIGFSKPPKIIYYELRIWKHHEIITMNVYTTLKGALNYYKKKKLNELEDNNQCYIEIIKVDNLNPRYK